MKLAALFPILAVLALAGCATTDTGVVGVPQAPKASAHASLLTHPERLEPFGDGQAQRWIDRSAGAGPYTAVMIEPIRVKLDAESSSVDPATLKSLTDYFREALVKATRTAFTVVDAPGPGVVRVRVTLVDLVATKPEVSVVVLVTPYASVPDMIISEASGVPFGSAPYLGRTGIVADFIDASTGNIVAEFIDLQFGRKYVLDTSKGATEAVNTATKSYLNQYSTWAYAKQAFDLWATQFRSTLQDMRASP